MFVIQVNPFHQDGGVGPCCGITGCPPCPEDTSKKCPGCDNRKCPGFGCPPPHDRQQLSIRKNDSKEGGLVDLVTLEDGGTAKRHQSTIVTDFGKLREDDQCGYFFRHLGAMLYKVRVCPAWTLCPSLVVRSHRGTPTPGPSACCTSSATFARGCSRYALPPAWTPRLASHPIAAALTNPLPNHPARGHPCSTSSR